MKMLRYGTGLSSPSQSEDVTRLDAFAALTSFLATEKMTACLQASYRISCIVGAGAVLFWREGEGDGQFAQFEGDPRVIAELTAIFRLLNDNEELREALRQRLCSETLPDRLWKSTASSQIGGWPYRMIVLMCMAGVVETSTYTAAAGVTDDVERMAAALRQWLDDRGQGRKLVFGDLIAPPALAA